jgi:hypothetical protein
METTQLQRAPAPVRTDGQGRQPPGRAAALALGCFALLVVLAFAGAPAYLLALPGLILGTMACLARPAAAVIGVLTLGAFIGTIIAFLGLPVDALSAFLLACLWIAAIGIHLSGSSTVRLWLWPALLPLALYGLISVVQMLTSESLTYALADFRITVWYMLVVLLLALAPWEARTFRRVALGLVLVALAVGLYALYRYIAGPSPEEFEQAAQAVQRVASSVPVRFFGSFLSAIQLTSWCATAIPFLLAMAFLKAGWWRIAAIAAIGLCAFAVFASDVRTGLVAAIAGTAATMALFLASRAFATQRVGASFLAFIGAAAIGFGAYAVVVAGNETSADRFAKILTPTEDFAFQERLTRWDAALDVVEREPLGHGLGTQGFVGQSENPDGQTGPFNLDSAYLKVGIQQGYLVMLLFAAAQLALLAGLAHRSVLARCRWPAALGIGACGALVAQMILYFNGIYSEGVTALSAWIVVGIGVAQFTSPDRLDPESQVSPAASR